MRGAKLYGSNWRDAQFVAEVILEANANPIDNEDRRHAGIQIAEDVQDNSDRLANEADASYEEQRLENIAAGQPAEDETLAPLILDPQAKIEDSYGKITASNHTYQDIIQLLIPRINNVKLPISQMRINQWYGIASLGATPAEVWEANNVVPSIGKVFKCIAAPPAAAADEAVVYESTPACMAVHDLSKQLNMRQLFITFLEVAGKETYNDSNYYFTKGVRTDQEKLDRIASIFYQFILMLLEKHNADETADAWTHVYDDAQKRKQLAKHAVFHKDEGIMHHPLFDYRRPDGKAGLLLLIMLFIETLPVQVQVVWAQNYIRDFITGYDQELETFDPTRYMMPYRMIASCVNGNLEKLLLTIGGAITHFYPEERPVEESAEEKLQLLRKNITESEFNKYFKTVQLDPAGPTIEGYINYIKTTPDLNTNEERRQQFLSLLEDPDIIAKIEETIGFMSGGRRGKNKKRKTIKKKKKTIKKRKSIKKKRKSIKKRKRKSIKKKRKSIKKRKRKSITPLHN
jgi:hypothetical protein